MEQTSGEASVSKIFPSRIPDGKILPVRHQGSRQPNTVTVGTASVSCSARDTVKQPVYLRKGYGIFLRKFQRPRRERYGETPPPRLTFRPEVSDPTSLSMLKTLSTPGVTMANDYMRPLDWARVNLVVSDDEKDREMQRAFGPSPRVHRPSMASLGGQWGGAKVTKWYPMKNKPDHSICYFDMEDRKPPPPFFIPHIVLPTPEIVDSSSESDHDKDLLESGELATVRKLLLGAQSPVLKIRSPHLSPNVSPTALSRSASSVSSEVALKNQYTLGRRRDSMPLHMPVVVMDLPPEPREPIKLTSSRVQPPRVDLGDVFPVGAGHGLGEEASFARDNFPLLVERDSTVDSATFTSDHEGLHKFPPETVARVCSLYGRISRQKEILKELRRTDEDVQKRGGTVMDHVDFNPLMYQFNKDTRKLLHLFDRSGKEKIH